MSHTGPHTMDSTKDATSSVRCLINVSDSFFINVFTRSVTDICDNSSYGVVVVVVITPPLPRDGGAARTAIQVHAVNLIEIKLGEYF